MPQVTVDAEAAAAPSCEQAAARIAFLDASEQGTKDPDLAAHVAASCRARSWSEASRRCVVASTSSDGIAECERSERLARGDDLGGPDCESVVAHDIALLRAADPTHGTAPDAAHGSLMRFCRARSRAFKECVLAAETIASYAACAAAESER